MILKDEIQNDPLARGYLGMTDVEVAESLNTVNREVNKESISASEIFNALDRSEFIALSAANKARVDRVMSLGNPILIQGNVKDELMDVFIAGSQTRANLAAVIKIPVSRAREIGIGNISTPRLTGDISRIR